VRGRFLAVLLAGSLLFAGEARAQQPSRWRSWYGWQLVLADAAALGLTLAPVDLRWQGATVTVGMTGLFINGAIINMSHDNAPAAAGSLLRLPAFLAGRLLGFAAGQLFCRDYGCKAPLLKVGSAFGLGSVILVDLLDAVEPTPWWLPESEPPPPPAPGTSPLADPPARAQLLPPALTLPLAAGRF
jgi:hypothetical protein